MATILEILVKKGVLQKGKAFEIRKVAKEEGKTLEDALYAHGVSEEEVLQAKSEALGIPITTIGNKEVSYEILKHIPEESARYYKFVPIGKTEGGVLEIGMLNPEDVRAQEALRFMVNRLGLSYKIYLITPSDFEGVFKEYKGLGIEVTKALSQFQTEMEAVEGISKKKGISTLAEEAGEIGQEAPVTKMMVVILRYAIEGAASDIHIEPTDDKVKIRFRVDGVLYTGLFLPKSIHSALITKIKVMTNMKIDESRIPQDGRFHSRVLEKDFDFRVSVMPTKYGEKVAIRVLDPEAGIKSLEDLGIEGRNAEIVREAITKPFGMVLITGPTGSGKSTTLNAILHAIDRESENVVSLEDPIEYFIPGVNQSQIRPEIGYSFASGLRSILRQDPDVIMVGEIRDKETAELAVHAALTGHLVLSTLHTNNAIGVIPRLIDMGIDPYLIPSSVILAIAQRLVRKLCPESKREMPVVGRVKEIMDQEVAVMPPVFQEEVKRQLAAEVVYAAEASPSCPKGTRGRVGVYEMLSMTPELEKIVLSGPSEALISEEARRQNMITMRQDGILKAVRGIIGFDELLEVV